MGRIVAQGDVIKAQGSGSYSRQSRESGNPSVLRYWRYTKSGGRAPALRTEMSRVVIAGCGGNDHLSAMKLGAPYIRQSRESGNPSVLRYLGYAKSGGRAPALRTEMSRVVNAGCGGNDHLSAMKSGAPLIRQSRESGNPSVLRYLGHAKSGGQAPALRTEVSRAVNAGCGGNDHLSAMKLGAPYIRQSRESGNPSVLRYLGYAKSGGRAPALRTEMSRVVNAGCGGNDHLSAMKSGAPDIRHSRESGNPSVLRYWRYTKSGGQAPALHDVWHRTRLTRTV